MDLFRLYARALGMLAAERGLAVVLAVASVAIGVVQLAEPILFGRVVDTLSGGAAFPYDEGDNLADGQLAAPWLREGRTTFIIAHRLSTVADADEILVFDAGRIVEHGRFEALARGKGLFARMVAEGGFTVPEAPET